MSDWPHAPVHRLGDARCVIVTAGTYQKQHFFRSPDRLTFLQDTLLKTAQEYGWLLQAWALFSNHYHLITIAAPGSRPLDVFVQRFHAVTAIAMNAADGTPRRKVWFQYWDTLLTYEKSYLARLNYVLQNPVRHGLVQSAYDYPWCSASWFERTADKPFVREVHSFKTDKVNVIDQFEVEFGDRCTSQSESSHLR